MHHSQTVRLSSSHGFQQVHHFNIFKIKAGTFRKRHSFIQLELAGNLKTLFDFRNVNREDGFFSLASMIFKLL